MYLCPRRRISFDGFVSRGAPLRRALLVPGKTCRVSREGELRPRVRRRLVARAGGASVTWSRKDSFCADQYADDQPVELPTTPVTTAIRQLGPSRTSPGSTSSTSRRLR